jgi:chaperonin GroEL
VFDDALAATRAAIDEGIVPGGGVALLRCHKAVEKLDLDGDEGFGVRLILDVLSTPIRTIAENAGQDGAVVASRILKSKQASYGYDAQNDKFGDMIEFGIIDPTKVVRAALQNAASVAGLLLTTDSIMSPNLSF